MYCVGHGAGLVERLNSESVAGSAIPSQTSLVLDMLFRSHLKPSTVDDVLFLHSNLKHHTKHQIVLFPAFNLMFLIFLRLRGGRRYQFIEGLFGCGM